MNIVALIVQLVSGAVGGNIAGAILKKYNLGPIGNSIVDAPAAAAWPAVSMLRR